jgi:hypothetical protein
MAATPRRAREVGKCGRLKADLRLCRRRGARITATRPPQGPPQRCSDCRPRRRARNVTRSEMSSRANLGRCCRPDTGQRSNSAGGRVSRGLPQGKVRNFFAITAGRARNFSPHPAMTLALFCCAAALRGGACVWARVRFWCPPRRRRSEIVTEVGLGHRSAAMAREVGRMAHP